MDGSEIKIDRGKLRKENQVATQTMSVQELCESLKEMPAEEILSVMVACVASMKKSLKGSTGGKKERKKGSMPKGEVPQQLVKPRAWVELTLQDAKANGWEAFQVRTEKKDKVTGEVTVSITEMAESELHNGTHIFKGSISEKTPNGKQLIHKDAMSLSKQRWAPKEQKGSHKAQYEAFEAKHAKKADEEVEIDMTPPAAVPVAMPVAQEPKKNKKK